MASLVQPGMYGAINTYDTTKNGFYIIQFLSEAYTLQNNTTIDGQVISAGELVVRHNFFAPRKETPTGIGKNNHLNRQL